MPKKSKKDDKKAAKEAEKKRKEEEKKRKEEEKKRAKEAKKKGKKGSTSPEPASPPKAEKADGDDGSEEEEEEDLMGDQSWAKTDDFSGALDDMFAGMLGDMDQMKADAEAAGVDINAKMGSMGEDAAAAEAEEQKKAAEQAAADAKQAEKDRLAKERAEKRKNMSKEDKMAKMKCKTLQKKADEMKGAGTLVDVERYEAALKLLEDEEWIQAEQALKHATTVADDSSLESPSDGMAQDEAENSETKRPAPEPAPEPEPEPTLVRPAQTLTEEMSTTVAQVQAVIASKQGESDFKQAVALLKAAIGADKEKQGQKAVLMYLAAANAVAAVNADPNSNEKQKAGLAKKLPQMDTRIATAFKDSRTLFDEIDADESGKIEPDEFADLMAKMQQEVQEGQFAAIDANGRGAIEYEELVVFLAEQGMQQNSQAFAAGWCALQGNDNLVLVEELERMALTEAAVAANKCMVELEDGATAVQERQAAAQAAQAEAAAAEAAKAAEEEAAAAKAAAEEQAAADAKAAEEKAAREAEETAAAAAKAAEEEAAAAAAAKAAEEAAAAAAAAKAAEEEAAAAAAAKAAEEEAAAAAAAKAAEEEAAAAAVAKAGEAERAAVAPKASTSESAAKDLPVMYCKKCKRTGPNPGTCSCPIFMKTTQLSGPTADAPAAAVSGTDNAEPAWQRERREREAAERERREREAKEREAREEEDRRAAAELKAREDERARHAAEERRKAAEAIARESERIEQRIAAETKRRADAEVARRVAEATQEKLRAEEARRQAAGLMALPKAERKRHAEAEVLKQQEKRAVKSAGEQFDEEARWREEQEKYGRRLFATAHGQDSTGPEVDVSAGLLGLPAGYSIVGPSVPLEERRADMHARSQALLGKLGVRGMRPRPATTFSQPVGEYLREQLDIHRPDGTQGAALAQGLTMLDSIRPQDPLRWLSEYLRDPTSEKWVNQTRAARQERMASMRVSGVAREEANSVEYLGRLRPQLHAALRSVADNRPQNAALAVSDFLDSNWEVVPPGDSDAATNESLPDGQADGASGGVDGDEVVE